MGVKTAINSDYFERRESEFIASKSNEVDIF